MIKLQEEHLTIIFQKVVNYFITLLGIYCGHLYWQQWLTEVTISIVNWINLPVMYYGH